MSNIATWIQQDLEELKDDPEFLTESLLLEVNESICELMEQQEVSRAELARRLKWRRSAVTKMLQGNHNISIGRLVKVALALDCTLTAPKLVPRASQYHLSMEPTYLSMEPTHLNESVQFKPYAPVARTGFSGVFRALETSEIA